MYFSVLLDFSLILPRLFLSNDNYFLKDGQSTATRSGWFEVEVNGQLVHSKKVRNACTLLTLKKENAVPEFFMQSQQKVNIPRCSNNGGFKIFRKLQRLSL